MSSADALKTMHPNDLARIKPPDSVVDKANWFSDSRRELLKRMLDASLEDTIPTPGLMKAFEQPQTVEAFASLITMDPTPIGDYENDFDDSRYQKSFVFPLKGKDDLTPDQQLDLRRAHRAMSILTADQPQLNMVMRSKPMEIIAPMFRSFRCQNSYASVFHLCRIIDAMLRLNADAVVTYLTGPRLKLCLQGLISNLHCTVVGDTLFTLLSLRPTLENGLRPDLLKLYHKKLSQANPLGPISSAIVASDTPLELKTGSSDLIMRLLNFYDAIPLEPPNAFDIGESFLFKALVNSTFLERLSAAAASDVEYEPALTLFSALAKLAAKGKLATTVPMVPIEDEDDKPKPTASVTENKGKRRLKDFVPPPAPPAPKEHRLGKLANELKSALKPQILNAACLKALESTSSQTSDGGVPHKHTSYDLKQPFTFRRMEWVRLMNNLLELDPFGVTLPWKSLVEWQMQYVQNSMLQNEFSKALQTVLVASQTADETKPAIVEYKLVTHLIRRAKANDTDHAHILKCLNLLRLKADLLPKQHWLVQYLRSHSGWVEFLPELKRQTQVILEPWLNEHPSAANPVVPMGTTSSAVKVDSAAAALNALFLSDPDNPLNSITRQLSQDMVNEEVTQATLDIELGSRYAKSLGFTALGPPPSVAESQGSSQVAHGATSGEKRKSSTGGKKKKKN